MMAGIGRGTYEKTFDGFCKFTILRQSEGALVMPVSVSALTSVALTSAKWSDPGRTNYFSSRLSFVQQLLVARKLNQSIFCPDCPYVCTPQSGFNIIGPQ